MTEGPDQSQFIPRHDTRPWEVLGVDSLWPTEQIQNLRQHEGELSSKGSELSHGPGIEPPWVTQREPTRSIDSRPRLKAARITGSRRVCRHRLSVVGGADPAGQGDAMAHGSEGKR
jgi:hypothetical protein